MLNRQNRPLARKRPEIADASALVVVPRSSKNEPQKTNRVRNIMLEKFEHYAFERQLEKQFCPSNAREAAFSHLLIIHAVKSQ